MSIFYYSSRYLTIEPIVGYSVNNNSKNSTYSGFKIILMYNMFWIECDIEYFLKLSILYSKT